MKIRIQLVEVEHIIGKQVDPTFKGDRSNFKALGDKFEYQSLCDPQELDPTSVCLQGADQFNNHMRQLWEQTNREPAFVPCGQVILKQFVTFGDAGLLIDFD